MENQEMQSPAKEMLEKTMGNENNLSLQEEFSNLKKENSALKDVLVNMLMQKELNEIKSIDSNITALEDMDLNTYFALRNQNIPIDIVLSALNKNKKSQPIIGDITQPSGFEKSNRYKEMPRGEFLKEVEKALRGELM